MSLQAEDLTDLGLDLGSPAFRAGPGRQAKPLSAEFKRALVPADLAQASATAPVKAKPLAKIRDSHHALARVLASGMSEGDASVVTGYSPSRISILKADPQFRELLEFYRESTSEIVADFRQRMVDVGLTALSELRDRLEDSPEDLSAGLLKDIVKDMADRTGHAPAKAASVAVQVNVGLTDRMKNARERVAALTETRRGGEAPVAAVSLPSSSQGEASPLDGEILPPETSAR